MKRIVSLLLAFAMLIGMLPMTAWATETDAISGTCGDNLTWELDEDGCLTVSGTGDMEDYCESWSEYKSQIFSVVIEDGVTSIGESAFSWCENIKSVQIAGSVRQIGNSAFSDCESLTDLQIADGVESIGMEAFGGCDSLIFVEIPASVTDLNLYAFAYCNSLKAFAVAEKNSAYTNDEAGILYNKDMTALIKCPAGYDGVYTVPDGTESIGTWSFSACGKLTGVIIPDSVTEIGSYAFETCKSLMEVRLSERVTSIPAGTFLSNESLTYLTIPESVMEIGEMAFGHSGLTEIVFQGNAPVMDDYAFSYVTATAQYPSEDETWTEDTRQNYGGELTWRPYVFEAHVHTYTAVVTDPSCTVGGYTTYTCSCGDSYVDDYVVAAGHSFGDWYETKAATQEETGEEQRDCTACDHFETRPVEKVSGNVYASGTCGENLTWVLDDEGTLSISGTGDMANYDDQNVSPWFEHREKIKTVVIDSGVTSVGNAAFSDFNGVYALSSVTIGDDVTSVGDYAFWCADRLTTVAIGNRVEHLGDYIFGFCTNLESINIPDSVISIGKGAFSHCNKLAEIVVGENNTTYSCDANGILFNKDQTVLVRAPGAFVGTYVIPNSVAEIGEDAFGNCDELTGVTIPDSVINIGEGAFYGCDNLISVTIPEGVTNIGEIAFGECKNLSSVVIPNSVVSIDRYAFSYCESLTSVTIGNGVTSIGVDAFAECSSLVDVYYEGTEEQWNKISINSGNDCLINAKIHFAKIEESENITGICGDNLTWVFNNGVLKISGFGEMFDYSAAAPYPELSEAPWKHLDIRSVIINEGVTCIGSSAFANSDTLSSVLISGSVTSIGDYAFHFCSRLSDLTLSDGIVTIGDYAFYDCRNLQSVTIPSSIESIGEHAFADCSKLSTVTLSEGITSIGDYAFISCESLSNIAIPESITHIGLGAFSSCFNLKGIWVAPSNANYASDSYGVLFSKNKQTLIQVPCTLEETYAIPAGVILIEKGAFHSCDQLNNISIPAGVTSIGNMAFSYCTNLTTIRIPDSITNIGDSSFNECINLADVFYSGTREKWEEINIGESNEYLINATLHYNSTGIDDESSDSTISKYVRYFTNWDAEKQIAYFDGEMLLGCQVTEETDLSFLENVDSLVGQYVLAETRSRNDGMMAPDTLLSIKPVESKTGTVTAADDDARTITIDGITYDVTMSRINESANGNDPTEIITPSTYVDEFVLYHIYEDKVAGIEILKTLQGSLTGWNKETRHLSISKDDVTVDSDWVSESYMLSNFANEDTEALLNSLSSGDTTIVTKIQFACDGQGFVYSVVVITTPEEYHIEVSPEELVVQSGKQAQVTIALYCNDQLVIGWTPSLCLMNNLTQIDAYHNDEGKFCIVYKAGVIAEASIIVKHNDDIVKMIPVTITSDVDNNDAARLKWINEHMEYASSDTYQSDIVPGYQGFMYGEFKKIMDDSGIKFYDNTKAFVNFLNANKEDFDQADMYEMLLAELMYSSNEKNAVEELYINNLVESTLKYLKQLYDLVPPGVKGAEDLYRDIKALNELEDLMSEDFFKAVEKFQESFVKLPNSKELLKEGAKGLGLDLVFDAVTGVAETTEETMQYMYYAMAYSATSDDFKNVMAALSEKVRHEMGPEDFPELGDKVQQVNWSEFARACDSFVESLEKSEQDGMEKEIEAIKEAGASQFGVNVAKSVAMKAFDYIINLIPVVGIYPEIRDALKAGLSIVEMCTDIDEQSERLALVTKLYCMSVALDSVTDDYANMLDEDHFWVSTTFDESISLYKTTMLKAIEYMDEYEYSLYQYEWGNAILMETKSKILVHYHTMMKELGTEKNRIEAIECHDSTINYDSTTDTIVTQYQDAPLYVVACPVDVIITAADGKQIAYLSDDLCNVAAGHEWYYRTIATETGEVLKMAMVPEGYNLSLKGTDIGTMNVSVSRVIGNQEYDVQHFHSVPVSEGSAGYFVDNGSEGKKLIVDDNQQDEATGKYFHTYELSGFNWAEDHTCVATFGCISGDDTQTANCTVTSSTTPATETEAGKIVYIATVDFGGQTYTDTKTETIPATGHSTHQAGTKWISDGMQHWHKCTGCDEKMNLTDHSGGTATCTKKAVCSVCGVSYGNLADHDYETSWSQGNANGHWHECKNCSAHDAQVKHTPGAAATEDTAQFCTVCGYVITPALGHTCTAGTKWYSNGTYHWHLCTSCGAWVKTSYHSYSSDTDETCNVCGYTRTVTATEPTQETEVAMTETTEATDPGEEVIATETAPMTVPTEANENISDDAVSEDTDSHDVSSVLITVFAIVALGSLAALAILLVYKKRRESK